VRDESPPESALYHHQLFKGLDFYVLLRMPGPREPSDPTTTMLGHIRDLEESVGPSVTDMELAELFDDGSPSGLLTLCYAGRGEKLPGTEPAEVIGNLRRVVDADLSANMLLDAETELAKGRAAGTPADRSGPRTRQLQDALSPDTVLISVYAGIRAMESDTDLRMTTSYVTLTRTACHSHAQDLSMRGGILSLVEGDTRRFFTIHSLAWPVAEIREAVAADPLFQPVSAHAVELIDRNQFLVGVLQPELLAQWREAGITHLCLWPNGPLHYLPFHLLHVGGLPLADDWTVTTIPSSASLLRPATRRRRRRRRLVSVGAGNGGQAFGLLPQPALESHAREVAARAGGVVLTGPDATPRRMLQAATRATYLHIAAHGSHDVEAAWFQCLFLNPDGGSDGRLFAHDILKADDRRPLP
jgi:hypothetical protein